MSPRPPTAILIYLHIGISGGVYHNFRYIQLQSTIKPILFFHLVLIISAYFNIFLAFFFCISGFLKHGRAPESALVSLPVIPGKETQRVHGRRSSFKEIWCTLRNLGTIERVVLVAVSIFAILSFNYVIDWCSIAYVPDISFSIVPITDRYLFWHGNQPGQWTEKHFSWLCVTRSLNFGSLAFSTNLDIATSNCGRSKNRKALQPASQLPSSGWIGSQSHLHQGQGHIGHIGHIGCGFVGTRQNILLINQY